MGWWGSIVGGALGFMLGGPLGALLGAALGSSLDRGMGEGPRRHDPGVGRQERVQSAFFAATFSVMGHIAKADGRVSESEIALAREVMARMDLSPEQKSAAMALFNEGKKDGFPLAEVLGQLRREIGHRPNLKRMFIEIQLYAAHADGVVHAAESGVLAQVRAALGYSQYEFDSVAAAIAAELRHRQAGGARRDAALSIEDAYAILNLAPGASDIEIKRAYRRLTSQHHPDKLVSKGMPEEMMKVAADRTHEIRSAYERIRQTREF